MAHIPNIKYQQRQFISAFLASMLAFITVMIAGEGIVNPLSLVVVSIIIGGFLVFGLNIWNKIIKR